MPTRLATWLLPALLAILAMAGPAAAQGGFDAHDSSQPIEIAADELVVEQKQQQALFTGNVQAVQGDMSLAADKLRVFYDLEGDSSAAGAGQAIRRIEVDGNVTLSSAEESATGSRGFYDVEQQMIELEGGVVLTQAENVIRGESLVIDLAAGTARVRAGKDQGGRVRALFVPGATGKP